MQIKKLKKKQGPAYLDVPLRYRALFFNKHFILGIIIKKKELFFVPPLWKTIFNGWLKSNFLCYPIDVCKTRNFSLVIFFYLKLSSTGSKLSMPLVNTFEPLKKTNESIRRITSRDEYRVIVSRNLTITKSVKLVRRDAGRVSAIVMLLVRFCWF